MFGLWVISDITIIQIFPLSWHQDERRKEIDRRKMGQEMAKKRQQQEDEEIRAAARERRKDKEEERLARERVK